MTEKIFNISLSIIRFNSVVITFYVIRENIKSIIELKKIMNEYNN